MELNLFGIIIHEADVALTDYVLAIECIVLAILLFRLKTKNSRLKFMSSFFYISLAFASFLGGTVHGFFPNKLSLGNFILWRITLVVIGFTALLSWTIAGEIISSKYRKTFLYLASIQFVLYTFYVIFKNSNFKIALLNYTLPIIFLLITLIAIYIKKRVTSIIFGITGILLTFLAGWVQQAKISIHPSYFNHNALYHVIQALGLVLLFLTLSYIIRLNKNIN